MNPKGCMPGAGIGVVLSALVWAVLGLLALMSLMLFGVCFGMANGMSVNAVPWPDVPLSIVEQWWAAFQEWVGAGVGVGVVATLLLVPSCGLIGWGIRALLRRRAESPSGS